LTLSGRSVASLSSLVGLLALLSGCPLDFETEPRPNSAPFTFFDGAPGDTTFEKNVAFRWLGTDIDSDVVAYQYQLVYTDSEYYFSGGQGGTVLRSIAPPSPSGEEFWSGRETDSFQSFVDLDDGYYEMRARSIDDAGNISPTARHRFYLQFDDVVPCVITVLENWTLDPRYEDLCEEVEEDGNEGCGRVLGLGLPHTFFFTASDESRSGATPRSQLEYRYTIRGRSVLTCSTHLSDSPTEWASFPNDSDVPVRGPTYTDLDDADCGWDFKVEVRDPAGRIGVATCCVSQTLGCQ